MTIVLNENSDEYYFDSEGCYITELLNTRDDAEVSIAKARVKPGVSTAWHKLKNTTERYCILSGSGVVEVGKQSPQKVTSNDVVIILPDQRQRITNNGQEDLVFLAICSPRFEIKNYQPAE